MAPLSDMSLAALESKGYGILDLSKLNTIAEVWHNG